MAHAFAIINSIIAIGSGFLAFMLVLETFQALSWLLFPRHMLGKPGLFTIWGVCFTALWALLVKYGDYESVMNGFETIALEPAGTLHLLRYVVLPLAASLALGMLLQKLLQRARFL